MKSLTQFIIENMKYSQNFITESARFEKIDKLKKEIDSFNSKDQRGPANVGEAIIHSLIKEFTKEGKEVSKVPSHDEMLDGKWLAYNPSFTDAIMWEQNRNTTLITWAIHLERKEAIIQGSIYYNQKELDDQLINNMNGEVKFIKI